MNRYLFEKKSGRMKSFFFDGIDCEWFLATSSTAFYLREEIYVAFTIKCGTMAIH
ncbi:AIG_G0034510.mRNA.1.CDS.1 [Saccharomyces cerevisiae]|nr:AIG_G0034510.mRNA.1.CDS.1 [Saccharomyces cerevisiae]CAI6787963.1 AIG_G0034510.mRNA.1.CDS.1 [Saccharomyces cerevisiae]